MLLSDPSIYTKKDKRMLVLLTFGSLIIVFRLLSVPVGDSPDSTKWIWSEESGMQTELHRRALDKKTGWDQNIPLANTERYLSPHRNLITSPRAAFLLGLPFSINSSGVEELKMLPGIGPKLAASIVEYRDRYGLITDRRTFMKVPGIGPKLSARLTPLLTFEEE